MLLLLLACRLTDADVDAALDPDGDGFDADAEDCLPMNAAAYPGAAEICDDGVVNDCAEGEEEALQWCRFDGELSASTADLKVVGEREGDLAGRDVSIVGDVDGDGRADLFVGTNVDTAYLLLSSGALATDGRSVDLGAADLQLIGPEVASGVGGAVTGAGDVDGDGRADLLVGSSSSALGGSLSGSVYLLRSKGTLSAGLSSISLGAADLILVGEEAGDEAGVSVHSAGDVDGDGRADVMVGARYQDAGGNDSGAAYLLLSSGALSTSSSTLDLSAADFKFVGEQRAELAGRAVSGGGDVDGDGHADVVVSATQQQRGGTNSGGAYLLLSSGSLYNGGATLSLSVADLIVVGEDEHDYAGNSVSSAGDVDGDGRADLFIGTPGRDSMGTWTGGAYLLLSSGALSSGLSGAAAGVELLDLENADLKLAGEQAGDWSGFAVCSTGDVDGDDRADLSVGSAHRESATPHPGLVYLFLSSGVLAETGSSLGLGDADAKIVGETVGDYAGHDVSTAGDVNGDGVDDLFMGAHYNVAGGTDAGAAYLLYGRSF